MNRASNQLIKDRKGKRRNIPDVFLYDSCTGRRKRARSMDIVRDKQPPSLPFVRFNIQTQFRTIHSSDRSFVVSADQQIPWLGAGVGIILGVIVVIADYVFTNKPTLTVRKILPNSLLK